MCEGDRNIPNFDRYNERNEQTGRDLYAKKHEAYGYVDAGEAPYGLPVLGNSQFSVKKKSLGEPSTNSCVSIQRIRVHKRDNEYLRIQTGSNRKTADNKFAVSLQMGVHQTA